LSRAEIARLASPVRGQRVDPPRRIRLRPVSPRVERDGAGGYNRPDMHELPVTEGILRVVLAHAEPQHVRRVLTIRLRIGELSDLEEPWIQRYFDHVSRGTIAEGARIEIEKAPARVRCGGCGETFTVNLRKGGSIRCPACSGDEVSLVSGDEYHVKSIEVQ
jgi:hydrogenase nickel incorporation protein HypA/HybF